MLGWPVAAQTNDRARTTIGIGVGLHAGASLWEVADQVIPSPNFRFGYGPGTYHLFRQIDYGFTFAAQVAHFSSDVFGLTAEFTYIGLKLNDACAPVRASDDPELATACAALGTGAPAAGVAVDQSGSTTLLQGGIVLRPFRPAVLQPRFKAMIGFAGTPRSTVAMRTVYHAASEAPGTSSGLIIYSDYHWSEVRPVFTLSAGVTTEPSSGLQFFAEVRNTFLAQSVVTGAGTTLGLEPPNRSVIKGVLSLLAGFEVVLARERGKRY